MEGNTITNKLYYLFICESLTSQSLCQLHLLPFLRINTTNAFALFTYIIFHSQPNEAVYFVANSIVTYSSME